jgi:CheY-like chemotaxis protein/HPt (histidine-containing phosphotransfer) domain-containing protein
LLVEDNVVGQKVAATMLENLGCNVDVVADGTEAVKAAIQAPYHAILMDCQIPVLDGYRATSEIRRLQGGSSRTPIIALTASPAAADRERCLAAGMDDYLAKPLRLEALAAVLDRWAGGRLDQVTAVPPSEHPPVRLDDVDQPADDVGPVLDVEVLSRLEGLGKVAGVDLIEQLATLFLAEADAHVTAMRHGLDASDAAAVARSAHTLRGASANIGATHLAIVCAQLEAACDTGDSLNSMSRLERLKLVDAELERVRAAFASGKVRP